ncbi:MAG: M24 family metallopeptidase [Deltaproteobacteria bacterium]|nr:MAG: M24 family metallopeptidase [Deltaproteobacteria bacterium]TMQ20253.1 MAG: M24 family metallopeptidase [Deltaproteobacteria bacterium]
MFDPAIYAARRDAYMQAIGPGAVAVVRSLPERLRNGDAVHVFRQHSDLVYLTGFLEPETTLVLRPGAETERVVMFVRPSDPEAELWDGRRAGVDGAVQQYGADAAYPAAELPARLWELIANRDELHYSLGLDPEMDRMIGAALVRLRKLEKRGKRPPGAVIDPRVGLHELRLFKRPEELATLATAARISCEAHTAAMAMGRPGVHEHQIEATIHHTFRSRGGAGPGYNIIVGAGDNATILHYIANHSQVSDGDLVLVDAGCEYQHYTADVTRTWPASGRFTAPQRRVYEAVLATQKSAIAMARPGATLDDLHDHCIRRLTEAMVELGLLTGSAAERVADQSFRKFYMHGTSHWLGLDVHDVGAYTRDGKPRPLEPGMVITVEPGLYIAAAADAPAELRGIGVRIEDDVVITADGCEVLTAACPKEIEDVERACR